MRGPLLASFPEVKDVVSQVGRPDDGTDTLPASSTPNTTLT